MGRIIQLSLHASVLMCNFTTSLEIHWAHISLRLRSRSAPSVPLYTSEEKSAYLRRADDLKEISLPTSSVHGVEGSASTIASTLTNVQPTRFVHTDNEIERIQ